AEQPPDLHAVVDGRGDIVVPFDPSPRVDGLDPHDPPAGNGDPAGERSGRLVGDVADLSGDASDGAELEPGVDPLVRVGERAVDHATVEDVEHDAGCDDLGPAGGPRCLPVPDDKPSIPEGIAGGWGVRVGADGGHHTSRAIRPSSRTSSGVVSSAAGRTNGRGLILTVPRSRNRATNQVGPASAQTPPSPALGIRSAVIDCWVL